ncbi:putative ribonuclease H-like domain-containing protein [Tanacetum coccineum]
MYNFDLKNVVPSRDLTCLFSKATIDESNLCHRRLGHVNFKTMNKLVKGNLVRGLPSKTFENDHTCVAYQKGKQHKASFKVKPSTKRQGPNWLFDIDSLSNSMNYQPVTAGNQANKNADQQDTNGDTGLKENVDAGHSKEENVSTQLYIVFPLWSSISSSYKSSDDKTRDDSADDAAGNKDLLQEKVNRASSTNSFNTVSTPVNTVSASRTFSPLHDPLLALKYASVSHYQHPLILELEDIAEMQTTGIFGNAYDDDMEHNNSSYADESVGAEANFNNIEPSTVVSPIPTTRIHSIHPKAQIIGDPMSLVQTRSKIKKTLNDESWVEAMQEELLQFKIQKVWTLVDLPNDKKAIGTKWVYRNKKVERGIVVRNKARLVAQGHKQEEGIDYDEMDVKSAFLYSTIKEEIMDFTGGKIDKTLFIKRLKGDILLVQVYVDDIIFGSTKKSLFDDFEQIMHSRFQMSLMGELTFFLGLQVKQKENGIFNSQEKFQVQLKVSHLYAVKRIFRYLKGRHKLGLWYPKDSPLILEAFSDSDYADASLDWKSTTGGYQFLSSRLISWQFKKQTMTKIHVDNKSAICVVKNHVYHSKIKHIKIRHHFIRDSYEKRLIEMVKIHIDQNVADLLTKAFNVGDEAVHKELGDRMERAATTASSFEAELKLLMPVSVYAAKYTLTVVRHKLILPGITYCYWATTKVKKVNGQDQIQALVDKQKVIITEESIRRDIHFDDAEGIVHLPNDTIFEELARMGAKTTAWNEFSSTMASAIICLANNQKFNFSKYVLDNMVKNLKGGVKFFMFPRFMQVFLDKQVEGMSKHKETFIISSHTKKVFANIRRQSEGFSGVVTPLFDTMMVQASDEVGEDSDHPTDSNKIPIDTQPSTSKPQKKHKPKRKQRKEAEVLDLEKCKTDQAIEIASLKKRFKKLEMKRKSRPAAKIDQDEKVNLINETQGKLNDEEMFRVNDIYGEEITVEDTIAKEIVKDTVAPTIPVTTVEVVTTVSAPKIITSTEELTLAQTLIEIKAAKPKTIKTVTTAATAITTVATSITTTAITRPKAKVIVFHDQDEQKKKDQIAADEELARQLDVEMQAKIEEEERIRRKKEEEANIALIELWENKQAMMETNKLLAERLQTRERGELTIEENSKEEKQATHQSSEEESNVYLTQAYGKFQTFSSKVQTYEEIERLFEKEMKRVNLFIPMDANDRTDKEQERSSKRGGDDLESNVSKKQKVDE